MKRKLLSLLCAVSMVVSLAACGNSSAKDYSGQTLTGQITAIDGSTVTIRLGELTENSAPTDSGSDIQTLPENSSGSDAVLSEKADSSGGNIQAPLDAPDGESVSAPGGQAPSDDNSNGQPPEKPERNADNNYNGQPPEKPEGNVDNNSNGQPPEKPEGNVDNNSNSQPPEKSDDNGGTSPDMPSGNFGSSFIADDETVTLDFSSAEITENGESIQLSEMEEGDIIIAVVGNGTTVSKAEVMNIGGMGGAGKGFGGSGEVTQGNSANTIVEEGTYTDTAYISTGDDENALRIDGVTVTLDGITVEKSAGATSNTEDGDFYGMNAALLATDGANVTITNANVTSSAQNGNGVFSYGSGTIVNISDSTITTTADNSGGIQTTGGGTTNAVNLTVETSGNSSAAIRSDRGGGTVDVDGGSYISNGYNSPAVYSTANITVKDAALTANNSEALVIEGKNSITLENCTVTGNMSDTRGSSSDENVHNVMIYQSMSGDADVGTSAFSMTGGSLTAKNGDMFYVTNTHCILTLSNVALYNEDADACLLRVVGNSASHGWGSAGANGAQVEFTADGQTLEGDIVVDTISTLNMTLTNGSVFTGSINIVNNAEGGSAVGDNAVVTVENGCIWKLTGNCTITSLTNNGSIDFNGYTITLADGTVLNG